MKKKFISIIMILIYLLPMVVFAQNNPVVNNLKTVAGDSGYDNSIETDQTYTMLGQLVSVFLSLLGIIFIILMIYGGYNWMIAAGDESKITTAKNTIKNAIIGLILVLASFGIWEFIYYKLV